MLLMVPNRRGHTRPRRATTGEHQGWSEGRGKGKAWRRAFIVVSVEKTRQSRVSRLVTGQFE